MKRRNFLKGMAAAPLVSSGAGSVFPVQNGVLVNDVQTGLNPTWVARIARPTSVAEIRALVKDCARRGRVVSVSASRHAAGGQQFAADSVLLDMRGMNRVVALDEKNGVLQVEAGIEWPELIQGYTVLQKERVKWGIRQKQGGADRMSLGGALSANAHGHGLGAPPMIGDVEWIEIVDASGSVKKCSRRENGELFSLVAGGYGLFGIITAVGLRLVPRRKMRRHVEVRTTAESVALIEGRSAAGAPYGYFQYSIDETSAEFLRTGVLTTYEDVSEETPLGTESTDIDAKVLTSMLETAHRDRGSAYRRYAKLELSKDGNVEWSDLHQLSTYPAGYHPEIEKRLGPDFVGADLILEVCVPRMELISLLEDARRILLGSEMPLVYGTVRFIEPDKDSYLAWAKKRYACVIFSPHTSAEPQALKKTGDVCRQLIRAANKRGGSFYLAYNRFATRDELLSAYPQFRDFLGLKKQYDPRETFQSDWYRYYSGLFS
jgi:FAD/FMN-containing dehydrogenase